MAARPLHIMLIAGEPSGDVLGARLMIALRRLHGMETECRAIRFSGIGGPAMARAGLNSLFPMSELSVIGLSEVLPRIPSLLLRIRQTVAAVKDSRPDMLVTIDSPDFVFRVAAQLKRGGTSVPVIHYVAPQVWAWRPGRANRIAAFVDHLLALLPFEPPFFEAAGLSCSFVGHPIVENSRGSGAAFRAAHGIPPRSPVLAVLPGSRSTEVRRLLEPLGGAVHLLATRMPELEVVVPTLPAVVAAVQQAAAAWPPRIHVVEKADAKADALAAADAALAASGTVSLELASSGTPHAVVYRLHPATAALVRRLLRVPSVNLINIVLGRAVIPEFLQEQCTAEQLARMAEVLLTDAAVRREQQAAAAEALCLLGADGEPPSERAARAVLDVYFRRDALSRKG